MQVKILEKDLKKPTLDPQSTRCQWKKQVSKLVWWIAIPIETESGNCYRPHPKDGEGNSFTLFVSSHHGGHLPWPGPDGGGYLPWPGPDGGTYLGQVQMGGVPTLTGGGGLSTLARSRWGVPTLAGGVPTLVGGYPNVGTPWPGQDEGYPKVGTPPPIKGLATQRAVCLLRSRRMTFLFSTMIWLTLHWYWEFQSA